MEATLNLNRRRARLRRLALVSTFGVVLASAFAVRGLFARPGESALRFVPANVAVFGTMDLSPSVSQTVAFKKIDDALVRNHMDGLLQTSMLGMVSQSDVAKELTPLTRRSAAFAIIASKGEPAPRGQDPSLFFIGLTDGPAAAKILKQHGSPQFYKGAQFYMLPQSHLGVMVIDDQLAISQNPRNLYLAKQVSEGAVPSIQTVQGFQDCRATLDADSNVMIFANPQAIAEMSNPKDSTAKLLKGTRWAGFGVSLRESGIAATVHGSFNPDEMASYQKLTHLAPMRADLYKVMPSGAYGLFTVSQPGAIADFALDLWRHQPNGERGYVDFNDGMIKWSGVDVEKEFVPALQGDAIIAAYPKAGETASGIDLLAVVDDSNGANPAGIVDRIRMAFDKMYRDGSQNQGELFVKQVRRDGDIYRLAPKPEADMQKGLGDTLGNTADRDLATEKTIVFATRNNTVFVATSQALLDKALGSFRSATNGLATDSAFGTSESAVADSQTLAAFSVSRIAEGVDRAISRSGMSEDGRKIFSEALGFCKGLTEPLTISAKLQATEGRLSLFIPMDYDKLLDIVGSHIKK